MIIKHPRTQSPVKDVLNFNSMINHVLNTKKNSPERRKRINQHAFPSIKYVISLRFSYYLTRDSQNHYQITENLIGIL